MPNTLDRINSLANERLALWRQAGKRPLTEAEQARVRQITSELDALWQQHRREVADRTGRKGDRL